MPMPTEMTVLKPQSVKVVMVMQLMRKAGARPNGPDGEEGGEDDVDAHRDDCVQATVREDGDAANERVSGRPNEPCDKEVVGKRDHSDPSPLDIARHDDRGKEEVQDRERDHRDHPPLDIARHDDSGQEEVRDDTTVDDGDVQTPPVQGETVDEVQDDTTEDDVQTPPVQVETVAREART